MCGLAYAIHSSIGQQLTEDLLRAKDSRDAGDGARCQSCAFSGRFPTFPVTAVTSTDYVSLVAALTTGSQLASANGSTRGARGPREGEAGERACSSAAFLSFSLSIGRYLQQ